MLLLRVRILFSLRERVLSPRSRDDCLIEEPSHFDKENTLSPFPSALYLLRHNIKIIIWKIERDDDKKLLQGKTLIDKNNFMKLVNDQIGTTTIFF